MNNKLKYLSCSLIVSTLFLGACAHHNDVRPGANNVHRVVLMSDNEDEAERNAIQQANHFCKEQGKTAGIIDEKKDYKGDMDEKSYKQAKTATRVAKAAGGMAWVFGGQRESNAGGIVGLGGAVGDAALGNGYRVEMKFKCL